MTFGRATSLGPLPITYQAVVAGSTRDIFTINADGTVDFHLSSEELGSWTDLDPTDGSDVGSLVVTAAGAATERTLAARFAERVNVKDFGAVGDNVTDDLAAINAAIAYAQASLTQRVIFFPRGTYLISASLTAVTGSYWNFVGEGRGVSTIRCTANDDIITIDVRAAISYFGSVKDLTLRGPSALSTSSVGFRALASTGSATGVQYWTFDCEMQDVYQGWLFDETGMSNWVGINQISSHSRLTFINCETLPATATNPTYNAFNFVGALNLDSIWLGGRLRGTNNAFRAGIDQAYCSIGDCTFVGVHFLSGTGGSGEGISVRLIGGSDPLSYNENITMIGCQFECTTAPLHLTRMYNCRFTGSNTNVLQPVFVNCDEDSIAWESRGSANLPGAAPADNLLTNGGKRIWQRGTSFVPGATIFMDDRWKGRRGANAAGSTYSRQTGFSGAQYCMRIQRDNGNAATDALIYGHQIESANCYRLAGKRVTVTADVRVGANYSGGTLTCNIFTGTGVDEVMNVATGFATGGANTAPTAQAISATATRIRWPSVSLPATVSEAGIAFVWTPSGTAGAADFVEITNIKFEVSAVGTRFENPPLMHEIAECQRFFQKSFDLTTAPASAVGSDTGEERFRAMAAGAVAQRSETIRFTGRVRARAGTIVTLYNPNAAGSQVRDQTAAADCTGSSAANISETGFSILTTGAAGTSLNNTLAAHWAVDAEID